MAKILILIGGHLRTAPRPQKEAETLANAGHEVTVRGFWFDPKLTQARSHPNDQHVIYTALLGFS